MVMDVRATARANDSSSLGLRRPPTTTIQGPFLDFFTRTPAYEECRFMVSLLNLGAPHIVTRINTRAQSNRSTPRKKARQAPADKDNDSGSLEMDRKGGVAESPSNPCDRRRQFGKTSLIFPPVLQVSRATLDLWCRSDCLTVPNPATSGQAGRIGPRHCVPHDHPDHTQVCLTTCGKTQKRHATAFSTTALPEYRTALPFGSVFSAEHP